MPNQLLLGRLLRTAGSDLAEKLVNAAIEEHRDLLDKLVERATWDLLVYGAPKDHREYPEWQELMARLGETPSSK